MKKREKLYLGLFSVLVILAITGVVYGVGTNLASTSQNPGHDASQISCDKCITDDNVALGAAIHTTKIFGSNGWFLAVINLPSADVWQPLFQSNGLGISDWNANIVEVKCRPVPPGTLPLNCQSSCNPQVTLKTYSGIQDISSSGAITKKWNENTLELSQFHPKEVYRAEYYASSSSTTPAAYQTLQFRVNPNDGTEIQVLRTYQGATGFTEQAATSWECVISNIF